MITMKTLFAYTLLLMLSFLSCKTETPSKATAKPDEISKTQEELIIEAPVLS